MCLSKHLQRSGKFRGGYKRQVSKKRDTHCLGGRTLELKIYFIEISKTW